MDTSQTIWNHLLSGHKNIVCMPSWRFQNWTFKFIKVKEKLILKQKLYSLSIIIRKLVPRSNVNWFYCSSMEIKSAPLMLMYKNASLLQYSYCWLDAIHLGLSQYMHTYIKIYIWKIILRNTSVSGRWWYEIIDRLHCTLQGYWSWPVVHRAMIQVGI